MDKCVRHLAVAVILKALADAPKDPRVTLAGLKPWGDLAGLDDATLRQALGEARDGRLAERLADIKAAAKREQQARVGRPRGRPKRFAGVGVNGPPLGRD